MGDGYCIAHTPIHFQERTGNSEGCHKTKKSLLFTSVNDKMMTALQILSFRCDSVVAV